MLDSNSCWLQPLTSSRSNMTKRPHHRCTWTVQLYSPGGGNVHSPPSNTCLLGPTWVCITKDISIGLAVFTQLAADSPYTLTRASPSLSKLPLRKGDLDPPSNTWFPEATRVHNPNDISIGFAGLTILADHATLSVTRDRIYASSTTMKPTNHCTYMNFLVIYK